jgi:hypothetical protein
MADMVLTGAFDSPELFANAYNKVRLSSPNDWYGADVTVQGVRVRAKSFGLWNQRLVVGNLQTNTTYHTRVSHWKNEIVEAVSYGK